MPSKDYLKLRNCPFCGGDAEIVKEDQFGRLRFFVTCLGCGIETPRTAMTKEKAAEAWNRRAGND